MRFILFDFENMEIDKNFSLHKIISFTVKEIFFSIRNHFKQGEIVNIIEKKSFLI